MKILYSSGNYLDNDQQLLRLLPHIGDHQLMVAAHTKSSQSFKHIQWTLDACSNPLESVSKSEITNLLGSKNIPEISTRCAEILLKEVDDFGPDLIISNAEPILANIAKALSIKLWYCSPLHLLGGVEWERGDLKYLSLLNPIKEMLRNLPEAEKILVYSPFGDLVRCPALKTGYEWVQPYWIPTFGKSRTQNVAMIFNHTRAVSLKKIIRCVNFDLTLFEKFDDVLAYQEALASCNWLFHSGETSYLADAIYNGVPKMCIAPNLEEPETLLNAILCKLYGIGSDVAQVELMGKYAISDIEQAHAKQIVLPYTIQLSTMRLDEKVNRL